MPVLVDKRKTRRRSLWVYDGETMLFIGEWECPGPALVILPSICDALRISFILPFVSGLRGLGLRGLMTSAASPSSCVSSTGVTSSFDGISCTGEKLVRVGLSISAPLLPLLRLLP